MITIQKRYPLKTSNSFYININPRYAKIFKNSTHLNQFFATFYDCITGLKHFLSINALLDNTYVLQIQTGENLSTAFYINTAKTDFFFYEKKTIKKAKIKKTRTYV